AAPGAISGPGPRLPRSIRPRTGHKLGHTASGRDRGPNTVPAPRNEAVRDQDGAVLDVCCGTGKHQTLKARGRTSAGFVLSKGSRFLRRLATLFLFRLEQLAEWS